MSSARSSIRLLIVALMSAVIGPGQSCAAPASYVLWGPFPLAPVTVDAVTFELIGGVVGNSSIPVRLTVY